jgi:hypothetical protein
MDFWDDWKAWEAAMRAFQNAVSLDKIREKEERRRRGKLVRLQKPREVGSVPTGPWGGRRRAK